MNQYLLSVHMVEGQPPPGKEAMLEIYRDVDAFNQVLKSKKILLFAGGLRAPGDAKVVRSKGGAVSFTDGPFAEAKEHIGGFWVIKAPNLDAALEWATQASAACHGPVEVREFQEPAPE
ncbi:MAG TPA: YciI family protein [Polyangiaceae bacterium]